MVYYIKGFYYILSQIEIGFGLLCMQNKNVFPAMKQRLFAHAFTHNQEAAQNNYSLAV